MDWWLTQTLLGVSRARAGRREHVAITIGWLPGQFRSGRRVSFMIEQLFVRVRRAGSHLRELGGREAQLAKIVGGGA
jgi:hypothetical protein